MQKEIISHEKDHCFICLYCFFISCYCAYAGIFDDALKFVEGVANEAGEALDSVIDSAKEGCQSIGNAASSLWQNAGEAVSGVWNWTVNFAGEKSEAIKEGISNAIETLNCFAANCSEMTEDVIKNVFIKTMGTLEIASNEASKIWNTIYEYANDHNIDLLTISKLTVAFVVRNLVGGSIGEIAEDYLSATLLDWFDALDITSSEKAESAALELENEVMNVE